MAAKKDDRLQIQLSDDLRQFLELKAEIMGKPLSTVITTAIHEMMLRDSASIREYLKLKKEIAQDNEQS